MGHKPLKQYVAYFWNGHVTVRATSLSAARREVKERWFSHEPMRDVEIYEDSPAYERARERTAAMDMAYDIAINDGGARMREVEAKYRGSFGKRKPKHKKTRK